MFICAILTAIGVISNPRKRDSYNLSSSIDQGYESYGDNEMRARIAETSDKADLYHAQLDWCNPGCQYGKNPFGPLNEDGQDDKEK